MITNIPSESDYQRNAIECWVQALETIYKIDKHEFPEELQQEIVNFSQPHYRTSIILLHQGIEAIMKSIICKHSPLLLIDTKRTEWPVLPNKKDKDFNELFTIGAESLLFTFCSVYEEKVDQSIIQFLERIRKLRNQIVHGFNTESIDPTSILIDILNSFTLFIGKDSWWSELKNFNWEHPLFTFYDSSFDKAAFAERLEYVFDKIGKAKFQKHSSFPLKHHRYLCPICKQDYEEELDEYSFKWATLSPNTPVSTILKCYNCDLESIVIRKECIHEDCRGNVIAEIEDKENCMTCGSSQEL